PDRAGPRDIMAGSDDGLPKLWLIRQALQLRRRRPAPFGPDGAYRPLPAIGARAGHVVAFVRGDCIVTVAPRLVMRLDENWMNTTLELPAGRWRNELTGDVAQGTVPVAALLAHFPVALLAALGSGDRGR